MRSSRCWPKAGIKSAPWRSCAIPDGIEIHETDHAAAETATQALLARDHVVLFEPAIRVGDFFIRIDVLVKDGNQLRAH